MTLTIIPDVEALQEEPTRDVLRQTSIRASAFAVAYVLYRAEIWPTLTDAAGIAWIIVLLVSFPFGIELLYRLNAWWDTRHYPMEGDV